MEYKEFMDRYKKGYRKMKYVILVTDDNELLYVNTKPKYLDNTDYFAFTDLFDKSTMIISRNRIKYVI